MSRKKSKGLPLKQPGEEPATDAQLGYLRSLADIDEAELQALGKWQASHLIDKLVKARDSDEDDEYEGDERPDRAPTYSISGLFKLVFLLLLAFIGWKAFSFVLNSRVNSSTTATETISEEVTPVHDAPPPKLTQTAEKPVEPSKPNDPEPMATQLPPGTLATLEGILLPESLITSEEITLRNATGKEVAIPTGSKIQVTNRSDTGTLTIYIGGALFVGNESRISGKVKLLK